MICSLTSDKNLLRIILSILYKILLFIEDMMLQRKYFLLLLLVSVTSVGLWWEGGRLKVDKNKDWVTASWELRLVVGRKTKVVVAIALCTVHN